MCSVADTAELSTLLDTKNFKTIKEGIKKIITCYKGGFLNVCER